MNARSALSFHNSRARIPEWSCGAGERWLLSAPTGWGKTVWLHQLALLRDAGHSRVLWNGQIVTPHLVARYRRHWMYLPQTGFRAPETIRHHLDSVLSLHVNCGIDRAAFHAAFRSALAELGLERLEPERRLLADLSGGELQAASLVRAVLLGPEGLFLDEPTSAMDAELAQRVERWIGERYPGAWIWVSHDPMQTQRLREIGAKPVIGG